MHPHIDSMTAVHPAYRLRPATAADTHAVRHLDTVCFPPDSPDKQRAEPGELEAAVLVGEVHLVVRDGVPLGYLHADSITMPGRIYVAGVAVHPSVQRRGLGTWMVHECLAGLTGQQREEVPIVTVTSPRNVAMLRVLFHHGFAARWALPAFFGPGRHRFGLQLRSSRSSLGSTTSRYLPADDVQGAFQAIDRKAQVGPRNTVDPIPAVLRGQRIRRGRLPRGSSASTVVR